MRLALIIDDYLPSSTRVGAKMFHELALELTSQGHEITVITPGVNQKKKLIEHSLDGVTIWKFSSGLIKDVNKVTRATNETLLSYKAWTAIKHKVEENMFDGVVYYSPSIFFGSLVKKLKNRCMCPAYLVLRDLFPQWIVDAGMINEGSIIERYFRFFERYSYSQADMIGLMSEKNREKFELQTNSAYSTEVLRNWASIKPHEYSDSRTSIRIELGLENKVIFFYGGNIGHAQDMSNLLRLARNMQHYPDAHFLFVGQGDEVELINRLAREWNLTNFSYLPSVDQNTFKNILSEIDIGLFSLSSEHTSHNFPGKLLGYMVQSLPILGSVNQGNDLLELVNSNNAGLITVNGNDNSLLQNAIKLLDDGGFRKTLGNGAYRLLCDEFAVSSIASLIIQKVESAKY